MVEATAVDVVVVDRPKTVTIPIPKALRLLTSPHTAHQEMPKTHMPNVSILIAFGRSILLTMTTTDGGYQNYVALWYQSLMYQQQQQGGEGSGTPPAPGA